MTDRTFSARSLAGVPSSSLRPCRGCSSGTGGTGMACGGAEDSARGGGAARALGSCAGGAAGAADETPPGCNSSPTRPPQPSAAASSARVPTLRTPAFSTRHMVRACNKSRPPTTSKRANAAYLASLPPAAGVTLRHPCFCRLCRLANGGGMRSRPSVSTERTMLYPARLMLRSGARWLSHAPGGGRPGTGHQKLATVRR